MLKCPIDSELSLRKKTNMLMRVLITFFLRINKQNLELKIYAFQLAKYLNFRIVAQTMKSCILEINRQHQNQRRKKRKLFAPSSESHYFLFYTLNFLAFRQIDGGQSTSNTLKTRYSSDTWTKKIKGERIVFFSWVSLVVKCNRIKSNEL